MRRCMRMNIGERVALVVLIHGGRGNASIDDLAEEAAHLGNSLQSESPAESAAKLFPLRLTIFAKDQMLCEEWQDLHIDPAVAAPVGLPPRAVVLLRFMNDSELVQLMGEAWFEYT